MGAEILGGLLLGGLGLGAAAISRNSQNNAASQAAAQENQSTLQAEQAMQQSNQAFQQAMNQNTAQANQTSKTLSSQIGDPVANPTNLAAALGYGSNSSIFQTSTLKTGRNTLLGN